MMPHVRGEARQAYTGLVPLIIVCRGEEPTQEGTPAPTRGGNGTVMSIVLPARAILQRKRAEGERALLTT